MWRSIGSVFSGSKNAGVVAETAKIVGTLSSSNFEVTDSSLM